jgi:hypothetical protein
VKQKSIQLSCLRYEQTPYKKGRVVRVWNRKQKPFFSELLSDIWRVLKWFKNLPGKKEIFIGIIFLIGFIPRFDKVKAAPLPSPEPAPAYIHPIARLQPAAAISVPVPQEAPPVAEPAPVAPPEPVAAPVVGVTGCGDSMYKQFIYQHESGCRTDAVNPIGACGLGQALPCSKMGCSLSDWACQDAFFDNYANSVYGGWANAYAFWQSHLWW